MRRNILIIGVLCGLLMTSSLFSQDNTAFTQLRTDLESAQVSYSGAAGSANYQAALNKFQLILAEIRNQPVTVAYSTISNAANYGKAWCFFRVAELNMDAAAFRTAGTEFDVFANINDSFAVFGIYMSGECKLREAIITKYEIIGSTQAPHEGLTGLDALLTAARDKFASVAGDQMASVRLKKAAEIRKCDAEYERGKIFQAMGDNDRSAQDFQAADYRSISPEFESQAQGLSPLLNYSEAMKCLELFLIDRGNPECGGLANGNFLTAAETKFREASRLHMMAADAVTTDSIWRRTEQSYSDAARQGMDEAYYWMGFIQLILDKGEAAGSFQTFINRTANNQERRIGILRADAQRRFGIERDQITPQTIDQYLPLGAGEDREERCLWMAKYLLKRAAGVLAAQARRGFINRAFAFLDCARPPDIVNLYRGIGTAMLATTYDNPAEKARFYREASNVLSNVGGECNAEARYIRAYCLFQVWDNDQNCNDCLDNARNAFVELVNSRGSVRALYYLAFIYKSIGNDLAASRACESIIRTSSGINAYRFLFNDANALRNESDLSKGSTEALGGISINNIRCPDYQPECENGIFYEKVATLLAFRQSFGIESIELLKKLALPKKSVYPTEKKLGIFGEYSLPGFTANIPELLGLERNWNLELTVLYEQAGRAEYCNNCEITYGEKKNTTDANGLLKISRLNLDTLFEIQFKRNDLYTTYRIYKGNVPGLTVSDTVVLAPVVSYNMCNANADKADCPAYVTPSGKNVILYSGGSKPAVVDSAFLNGRPDFRDFAVIERSGTLMAVSSQLDTALVKYSKETGESTFPLQFGESDTTRFNTPEGIAIDSEGNIYVADWGNHRVVIFDGTGLFVTAFGIFGRNSATNAGENAKLVFPTRIVIEESPNKLSSGTSQLQLEKHILVADRYGIHKFDSQGHYLDTPVPVSDNLPAGSFYAFTIEGYGSSSKIILWNRTAKKYQVFCPSEGKY